MVYEDVKQYLELIAPEASKVVKLYTGEQPIFDKFDITRQMKTGLGRTVGFKKGGYLIMDRTEALFSIDVNSGSKKLFADQEQNAFHFNMLAADEIVHQLRLRDIGGIIVVDFIDMDDKANQQALYEYMQKLMSHDRAKHNVLPLSKFGLMQITRQRVRPAVEMNVMETCPTCMGKGKIQASLFFTDQIQEQIEAMVAQYGRGLRLHLHPFVFAYTTKGFFNLKKKWAIKYGVRVIENQSLGMLETKFYSKKGEEQTLQEDKACEKQ
jgi:ribonuclease G